MDSKKLAEECKMIGLDFVKIEDMTEQFKFDALSVDCDLFGDADISWLDGMMLEKRTGRKDLIYMWFEKPNIKRVTTLKFAQPFKELQDQLFYKAGCHQMPCMMATVFADFCWYHAEGTTEQTANEVVTPFRENVQKADLTRFLTCRFADNLVEIAQTLNQTFFEGIMFDSILYGPNIVKIENNEIKTIA